MQTTASNAAAGKPRVFRVGYDELGAFEEVPALGRERVRTSNRRRGEVDADDRRAGPFGDPDTRAAGSTCEIDELVARADVGFLGDSRQLVAADPVKRQHPLRKFRRRRARRFAVGATAGQRGIDEIEPVSSVHPMDYRRVGRKSHRRAFRFTKSRKARPTGRCKPTGNHPAPTLRGKRCPNCAIS